MTTHDHKLAGDLVRHFQQYEFSSVAAFSRAVGADRSTIYRMFEGSPGTKAALLRRTERALHLPDFALDMVKEHDLPALQAAAAPAEVLAWLGDRLQVKGDSSRRNVSG